MILSKVFLFPYWLALRIRHKRYDSGWAKSVRHEVPVISVGNVNVGGTGKTPMVEYLVNLLQGDCRVAVLSRGYKRKGKGFHLVEPDDPAQLVGDEPLQIKRKFPDVPVAVDKDRNHGVEQLLALPEGQRPELILLDDGFQYRRLKPSTDLVLVDYNRPIFEDNLLPLGRPCRSRSAAPRQWSSPNPRAASTNGTAPSCASSRTCGRNSPSSVLP